MKEKPKQPANKKANPSPSEPVGNGAAAKYARPVWVDESDAAELPNFEPSPRLFWCACAFIFDAAQMAFANGDNDFLIRDGVADALAYIAAGDAGNNAAAYSEILEEWRERQEERRKNYEENIQDEPSRINARSMFWELFNESKKADAETMRGRADYLRSPYAAEQLRCIRKLGETDTEFFDKMTDAILCGTSETENPNPARVRAEWLNDTFSLAGDELARWVKVAVLPKYADTLAEIKKAISDNFGVFPSPFAVSPSPYGDFVETVRDELSSLVYIARAAKNDGTPEPKKQNAGHCGGISQAKFAALLKHYGGKKHGEKYTRRTVIGWESGKTEAPTAGGVKYCAELRRDILKARTWAYDFNRENENAYNARAARV